MKYLHSDEKVNIASANRKGDIKYLEEIFVNKKIDILEVNELDKSNYLHNALFIPFGKTPEKTVRFYIEHGVSVNAQDYSGSTPLHYAVQQNNFPVVNLLLKAGADPKIKDQDGTTPFDRAFGHYLLDVKIIEILLQYGADPNYSPGDKNRLEILDFVLSNAILTNKERENIINAKKVIKKYVLNTHKFNL